VSHPETTLAAIHAAVQSSVATVGVDAGGAL